MMPDHFLKPFYRFSFIFAIILIFLISGSILAASGQTGTAQQENWRTYEDYDPLVMAGFSVGHWRNVAVAEASGGQLTETEVAGASLTVYVQVTDMTGGFAIVYTREARGGDFTVHLDGNLYGNFSSYEATPLYSREIIHATLPAGIHTLTMTNGADRLWIEAIRVLNGQLITSAEAAHPVYPVYPTPWPEFEQPAGPTDPVTTLTQSAVVYRYFSATTAQEVLDAVAAIHADPAPAGKHYVILVAPGTYRFAAGYPDAAINIEAGREVTMIGTGGIDRTTSHSRLLNDPNNPPTNWTIFEKYTSVPINLLDVRGTVHLYNIVIKNGGAYQYPNYRFAGGGIRNYGILFMYNSQVEANTAGYYGGGMFNRGTATLINTKWLSNQAIDLAPPEQRSGGSGSAIRNDPTAGNNSPAPGLSAFCNTFEANLVYPTTSYNPGGAIDNRAAASEVNLQYNNFKNNVAEGTHPWCSMYGILCDLPHIRDVFSSTPLTAPNNYWSNMTTGSVSGVNITPYAASELPYNASPLCSVPPPPVKVCRVVNTGPGRANEVEDMQAVLDPQNQGLLIHAGPALNAMEVGVINWHDYFFLKGVYEVTDGETVLQRWFLIDLPVPFPYPYDPTIVIKEGWILGWMQESGQPYAYVENSPDCTINGQVEEFTFPYDRKTTVDYAIAHSYRNEASSPPSEYTTQRIVNITPNFPAGISLAGVPYADFETSTVTHSGDRTGSTTFISESYWMGGFPFTWDVNGNTEVTTCQLLSAPLDRGWRRCTTVDGQGDGNQTWLVHEWLVAYYTYNRLPVNQPENILNIDIGVRGKAIPDMPVGAIGSPAIEYEVLVNEDMIEIKPTNQALVRVDATAIAEYIKGENCYTTLPCGLVDSSGKGLIHTGDYVWINAGNTGHGLIIAGWAEAKQCQDILEPSSAQRVFLDNIRLFETYEQAISTITNPVVPYVVDFSYQNQQPIPRPFYCTAFDPDPYSSGPTLAVSDWKQFQTYHNWYFYRMPNYINIDAALLYFDPDWNW